MKENKKILLIIFQKKHLFKENKQGACCCGLYDCICGLFLSFNKAALPTSENLSVV